ncbi:hypothetical protein EON79_23870 [bacterium]|nr:MAG: hypothetical protein EON79_23870 [bacterium]
MRSTHPGDVQMAVLVWVKSALSAITGVGLLVVSAFAGKMGNMAGGLTRSSPASAANDPASVALQGSTDAASSMASVLVGMFVLFSIVILAAAAIEVAIGIGFWHGRRRGFVWGVGLEGFLILLGLLFFSPASVLGLLLSAAIAIYSYRRLRGTGPEPVGR